MKKLKSVLALVLVFCMILSNVVVGSTASVGMNFIKNPPASVTGGGYIMGNTTVATYSSIVNGAIIDAQFDLYVNPDLYVNANAGLIVVDFDKTLLEYSGYKTSSNLFCPTATDHALGLMFLVMVQDPYTQVGADGFVGTFTIEFAIKNADDFKNMNAANGTLITQVASNDPMTGMKSNGADEDFATLVTTAAKLTYSAGTVSYEANGGAGSTLPAPAPVGPGQTYTVPSGITLTKDVAGVTHILSGWTATGLLNPPAIIKAGYQFTMGDNNVVLTAHYSPDSDGDGVPDDEEHILTYSLRSGDQATLDFSATTTHGSFFNTNATSGSIGIEKGMAVGNAVPTITLDGAAGWKLIGFFNGETNVATTAAGLATYTPTADTTLEIRVLFDPDGNGLDARDPVDLIFKDGAETLDTVTVPYGTPYKVYKNEVAEASSGFAGKTTGTNPTVVDVAGVADAKYGNSPFDRWEIVVTHQDGDTSKPIILVEAKPIYKDEVPVIIPGPIIEGEGDAEVILPEKEVDLISNSYVVYRVGGVEVKSTLIDGSNLQAGRQLLVHPTIPAKDAAGNPFKGWKWSGPSVIADVTYYYMDAVYKAPVHVTVKDNGGNTVSDGNVPAGTQIVIKDENGNNAGGSPITVENDRTITLPSVPVKNNDGDVFKEWGKVGTDTDGDGVDDVVTYAPVYEAPTAGEIDITPGNPDGPGAPDGIDAGTGFGMTILRGEFMNETVATATFYLRVQGAAATAVDGNKLTITADNAYGFDTGNNASRVYGNLGALTYAGTEIIGGVSYGKFTVTYSAFQSTVVIVNASYAAKDGPVSLGHIVVVVGDNTKDSAVRSSDYAAISRVVTGINPVPQKGSAGAFVYELMDNNKDKNIRSSDVAVIQRMVTGLIASN